MNPEKNLDTLNPEKFFSFLCITIEVASGGTIFLSGAVVNKGWKKTFSVVQDYFQ